MKYTSTRDQNVSLTGAQAILQGLSKDGGLLVPEKFPRLHSADIEILRKMTYPQRAATIMELFLPEFSRDTLYAMTKQAYSADRWDNGNAAPLCKLDDTTYTLELWHGPTSAFKDIALQMLPRLTAAALEKTGERSDIVILVATSGDTGKAALEGFADVPRTKIMVFYPENGVSDIQKLQMATQSGDNVNVIAVKGNFDDAQTGVKRIFGNAAFAENLLSRDLKLSSANSINWGRLLPQIVYYFSSYLDLVSSGEIEMLDHIDYCVPTGNFGNILAGYYARKMGLPIGRFICAANKNDVLDEFIKTGHYNAKREFYATSSPSMDILISSNLERLLYDLSGQNAIEISGYMSSLRENGKFTVSNEILDHISDLFVSGSASDDETASTIRAVFNEKRYLMDTHTAVALKVLQDIRKAERIPAKTVIVSTASPYKFGSSVLNALGIESNGDGFNEIAKLEAYTNTNAPEQLKNLRGKNIRFKDAVSKDDMQNAVVNWLA